MRTPPNLHRALSALQRLGLACAAGVALLISTGTALAAPANDDFANAINLPGNSGTQTGTNNTDATLEVGEPNPGATNTVWFKWTCPADGNFTYGTLGSTNGAATEWDAIIGIYTGAAVNALSPLGATPKDTVLEESMTIPVTGGTTYYIQLAGFGGETAANILLNWNFVATIYQAEITAFGANVAGSSAVIDNATATEGTVEWTVPFGTTIATLAPTFTLSTGATCNKTSGVIPTPNFSSAPLNYIVTAQGGSLIRNYTVTVSVAPASSDNNITAFGTNVAGSYAVITDDFTTGTIAWIVPAGTDIASLAPTFTLSFGATCDRTSGVVPSPDFSSGALHYIVTAQDGSTKDYTVTGTVLPSPPVTDGMVVWLPAGGVNTSDSNQVRIAGADTFVKQWNDLTVNANNATQTTEANQPKYIAGGMNGQPVIRFNDASSFTTADLSAFFGPPADPNPTAVSSGSEGAGINGTYVNTPTRGVTGALVADADTATSFNGTSQYMNTPYSAALNPAGAFTAEIWANPTATDGNARAIFSSGNFGNPRTGWIVYNVNGNWDVRLYINSGTTFHGFTVPITVGSWQHLALVYDGGTGFQLYKDGVAITPANPVGTGVSVVGTTFNTSSYVTGATTGFTAVGARWAGAGFANLFAGQADEFAFYGTALSATRIQAHYENGMNAPTPRTQAYSAEVLADAPVGYYRLNEPAAPVVVRAATGFVVTTINNDNAYTLVKANPGVDEWWRYDGNGKSYPGFFRGNRLEEYCVMPTSGAHLFAISSSPSAWEMSINGVNQGGRPGNYNTGGALVIGHGSSGGGLKGDIAELILYNRVLTAGEAEQVGSYLAGKYGVATSYGPPEVVTFSPPDDDTTSATADLLVTFDKPIAIGTGTITIKNLTTPADTRVITLPDDQVTVAGAVLTINPMDDLILGKNYAVQIAAGAIKNLGDTPFGGILNDTTWNFATAAPTVTATAVVSSGSPTTYGESVTFTATVSPTPSGGTVQFYDGVDALGAPVAVTAGVATYATPTLGATPHGITAEYSGNFQFVGSTSASISQGVNKAGLTVTAQNVFRFQNTANPDPLPYQITGFVNGQTLGSSGVTGTAALSTTADLASPVADYPIISAVGTLTASNYSFTTFVDATLTVVDPATPLAINVNIDDTVRTGLEGPGGGLGAVWNTIAASSATNLRLASGPTSTVGFSSSGTGGWFFGTTADIDPDLDLLTHGWINFGANSPSTQQLVINGLDPAKTYDLSIASAIIISSNQCSRGEWFTSNTTSTVGNQTVDNRLDENSATWVRGNNYVLFEDVVPDGSGNITVNGFAITEQPTYDIRLPLNGFQIREAFDPPAFRWKGASGGNWTDVANWNNTVPGAADIAILSDSATAGQTLTLDADAAVAGLTFNNLVANQVIASPTGKTLTLASATGAKLTVEGTHSVSANVDITNGTKIGPGTMNLSGTVAVHHAGSGNIAMFVSEGVLGISGTTTVDPAKRFRVDGSGTLEVTGVLNTAGTLFPVGSGGSTATATVILKGSGQWNQTHSGGGDVAIGISGANNGKLIIQDTAQLNSAFMVLGFFGPGTGTVQQDGGTVTLVTTPANYTALARPALWIGVTGPGDYHLNGGTLTCGTIGGSGKLYLNGGRLVANMDDLIIVDPGGALSAAVGQTSFMQGLNQVVVQSGAVIDTAGNIITIAQNLEHDTDGPAIDGGLTKQGLGTLKLLGTNTYTGATKVQGGTLACATAASLAPTALEIDAAAKVNLNYTGAKEVASLTLGGVAKTASGTYGSVQSGAAFQDDTYFAGTGMVRVGGSTSFTTWASTNGATGQTPEQDHDNDGVQNGIEHFMGLTGSSFTAMPGLDATNKVSWTMDTTYQGTYEVQTSPDLATWTNVDPRPLPSGGTLSYTLPADEPGGRSFVRLLVTPTP